MTHATDLGSEQTNQDQKGMDQFNIARADFATLRHAARPDAIDLLAVVVANVLSG